MNLPDPLESNLRRPLSPLPTPTDSRTFAARVMSRLQDKPAATPASWRTPLLALAAILAMIASLLPFRPHLAPSPAESPSFPAWISLSALPLSPTDIHDKLSQSFEQEFTFLREDIARSTRFVTSCIRLDLASL